MSVDARPQTITSAQYGDIFRREQAQVYPMVDAYCARVGYPVQPAFVEPYARVLSCPWKAAPPNWQHGRVLYAITRAYLARCGQDDVTTLDIGTAKGYSALMVTLACLHSGVTSDAYSVDVLSPTARARRNTVAEVDGLQTLAEILAEFPEAAGIQFKEATGIDWLTRHSARVHVAFVDGKHDGDVVLKEGQMLTDRQKPGDVAMFDDVHIPALARAVSKLNRYEFEYLQVLPGRKYAIGVRQ